MRIMRREFERFPLQRLCAHQITLKALGPALSAQAVSSAVLIFLVPEGSYRLSQSIGGSLPVPFRAAKRGERRIDEGGFEGETATMIFYEGRSFEEDLTRLCHFSGLQVAFYESVVDLNEG